MKNKQDSKMSAQEVINQNKLRILKCLKTKTNVKKVEVTYSGSGDSGAIEEASFLDIYDKEVKKTELFNTNVKYKSILNSWQSYGDRDAGVSVKELERNITEAIDDFCWQILETTRSGWEINDGAEGSFNINVDNGTITLSHTEFYTDSNSYVDVI
jgi:hypothetical protein